MLSTPLLAFGLTHLTDARYFAAWGARYLCFTLNDVFNLNQYEAIKEWVEGPECALDFTGKQPAEWPVGETVLLNVYSDGSYGGNSVVRVPVAGYQSLADVGERMNGLAEGTPLLLDLAAGGLTYADLRAGYPFSDEELADLAEPYASYLHCEMTPAEATAAASLFHGLAFRGSSEEKVGYKSFEELDEIFEMLEG